MTKLSHGGSPLERRLLAGVERALAQLPNGLAGRCIVAAVSGGPDSMALLLLLERLRSSLDFALHMAHADHGLRGEESREDARFVEAAARGLGLPFTLGLLDVSALRAERRMSIEEAAREARYAFLAETASALGAPVVALGHTADDQAETLLMRLLRGSGSAGLAGMTAVSSLPAARRGDRIALVRPLLDFTKAETRAYCTFRDVTPREDSSNTALEITRNRVRLELLPMLERYNPRIRQALLRLGASAALDHDFLVQAADEARDRLAADSEQGGVSISRAGFLALHPALRRHVLRRVYAELAGSAVGLSHRHVEDMARLASGRTGARLSLPGGLAFEVGYDTLRLAPAHARTESAAPIAGEHALSIPGETRVGGWLVLAELPAPSATPITTGPLRAALDADRVGVGLHVRSRRPGDRINPLGMAGSRKVQDVMVDERIPAADRDGTPLVVSDNGVVWVVGHRMAHWARVREDTQRVLVLEFRPASAR